MAVTQDDIDALNRAIRDGVRSVTVGGETTIYNTTDSLIRARDDAVAEFNAAQARAATPRARKQTYAYYSGRGY
jgi:hypothetical protein